MWCGAVDGRKRESLLPHQSFRKRNTAHVTGSIHFPRDLGLHIIEPPTPPKSTLVKNAQKLTNVPLYSPFRFNRDGSS